MGWSIYYEKVADPVAEVRKLLTWHNVEAGVRGECLDAAKVGGAVYAAVRLSKPDMAPYVFAAVFLVQTHPTFGYKDMDESMGPCEVACPKRIMALLTPLDQIGDGKDRSYAADWRARVAAYHEAEAAKRKSKVAMVPGARVRLAKPARFNYGGGIEVQDFIVQGMRQTSRKRRSLVFLAEPKGGAGFPCRLSSRALAGATITVEG